MVHFPPTLLRNTTPSGYWFANLDTILKAFCDSQIVRIALGSWLFTLSPFFLANWKQRFSRFRCLASAWNISKGLAPVSHKTVIRSQKSESMQAFSSTLY